MKDKLLKIFKESEIIEEIYTENPEKFRGFLEELSFKFKDNFLFQQWLNRIELKEKLNHKNSKNNMIWFIFAGLISGFAVKSLFTYEIFNLDIELKLRIAILLVASPIFVVLSKIRNFRFEFKYIYLGYIFISALYLVIPSVNFSLNEDLINDLWILVLLHIPLVLWSLQGYLYLSNFQLSAKDNLKYLELYGNLLISFLVTLFLGIVFTLLFVGIFNLIKIEIFEFAFSWIGSIGFIFSFFFSYFIAIEYTKELRRILPFIMKGFVVFGIVLLIAFFFFILTENRHLYSEKSNLIILNCFTIFSLSLIFFIISESESKTEFMKFDSIIIILLILSEILSAITLLGSINWLFEKGISPYRLDSFIFNLIISTNILFLIIRYLDILKQKKTFKDLSKLQSMFLSIYFIYALFIIVSFSLFAIIKSN